MRIFGYLKNCVLLVFITENLIQLKFRDLTFKNKTLTQLLNNLSRIPAIPLQGSPMIEHGGGINGFLTASLVLPEDDVFIAVFSNCNYPGAIANLMAAIVIDKPFSWEKTSLDDELMNSYQGVYEKGEDDVRVFTYEDEQMHSLRTGGAKYEIHPFAKDQFFFDDSELSLTFNRGEVGELKSVTLKSTGKDQTWLKTDKPIPTVTEIDMDPNVFATYVGKYELAPDFYINLFAEEDTMYTQATGQSKIELVATANNKFTLKDTDIKLTLNSNEAGEVKSLTLHQNGDHPAKKVE